MAGSRLPSLSSRLDERAAWLSDALLASASVWPAPSLSSPVSDDFIHGVCAQSVSSPTALVTSLITCWIE